MAKPAAAAGDDRLNQGPTGDDPLIMSVSRLTRYKQCPQSYKLEKKDKKWSKPAAWFPQGTGFHLTPEAYEKSGRTLTLDELEAVYTEGYWSEVDKILEETPNTSMWFPSGPYKPEADIQRRYGIGLEQVGKYYRWIDSQKSLKPWNLPDGTPAVEVPFETDLKGIPLRGYIDQVFEGMVIDWKTGNKAGQPIQLETYAVALRKQYGYEPKEAAFWMAKKDRLEGRGDISKVSEEQLADIYGPVYEDIKAEKFDPTPSDEACGFCGVRWACPVWN